MAQQLDFRTREAEAVSEVEDERHDARAVLRLINDGVELIGRKNVCYALEISESLLSRKLSGAEDRVPDYRLLSYVARRYEPLAQHLARRWGYAPLVAPATLTPEQKLERVMAQLHQSGEFGQLVLERALGVAPAPGHLRVAPTTKAAGGER